MKAVLSAGAKGDGLTDDWAALQRCVAQHDAVVLPKGIFRVSRSLVLRRGGGGGGGGGVGGGGRALVGVGRTLSFLAPTTDAPRSLLRNGNETGTADWPLLDVVGGDGGGSEEDASVPAPANIGVKTAETSAIRVS